MNWHFLSGGIETFNRQDARGLKNSIDFQFKISVNFSEVTEKQFWDSSAKVPISGRQDGFLFMLVIMFVKHYYSHT